MRVNSHINVVIKSSWKRVTTTYFQVVPIPTCKGSMSDWTTTVWLIWTQFITSLSQYTQPEQPGLPMTKGKQVTMANGEHFHSSATVTVQKFLYLHWPVLPVLVKHVLINISTGKEQNLLIKKQDSVTRPYSTNCKPKEFVK